MNSSVYRIQQNSCALPVLSEDIHPSKRSDFFKVLGLQKNQMTVEVQKVEGSNVRRLENNKRTVGLQSPTKRRLHHNPACAPP
jgi:hypothetical protein